MPKSGHSRSHGNWRRRVSHALVVCGLLVTLPSAASAAGEVTGVIGGLIGGDLNNVIAGSITVGGAFDNGPLYGVRLGWLARFVGLEGSFVYSPSGVSLNLPAVPALGLNAKVYYAEGNVLFIFIPGPVSPFVTAGAGYHHYSFDISALGQSLNLGDIGKLGYNFGGGVKINIKVLTIRGEVRGHLTRIGPSDFNLGSITSGLLNSQTLHNIEISGGVGVRF